MDNERIDAVYTWTDGSDPQSHHALQASVQTHCPLSLSDISPQRFRNNGELQYSLRSLERFAPWVHKIHLVTNGQVPSWLNTTSNRISIVTHDQIFRDHSHLPTFNSHAIELQLHQTAALRPAQGERTKQRQRALPRSC